MYLPLVREFTHVGIPYCYRCVYNCIHGCENCAEKYAGELEKAIELSEGEAAAFVLEPVSGATLGAAVPTARYMQGVAEICQRNGVLLIADEVMTGMGRTGRNFAVDHWGVAPDILVAAKGLSSGYAPLGAVLASKRVVDAIAKGSGAFLHGFTYNAHPLSVAAGRAVLRYMKAHDLVQAADSAQPGTPASHMKSALPTLLDQRAVGDVRGIGLLWGVEFVADKTTKTPFFADLNFAGHVGEAAKKRGLLVYPMQGSVNGHSGDHLLLAPPAVITAEQIDWAVGKLREAIEEVWQAL
jgi:adenosylmethionine-8-amino-7-oxononanoate aminotransferase